MVKAGEREAARLHYTYCPACSEYKAHTVKPPVCAGNCGLLYHDDRECPLVGRPVIPDYGHMHTEECFDC